MSKEQTSKNAAASAPPSITPLPVGSAILVPLRKEGLYGLCRVVLSEVRRVWNSKVPSHHYLVATSPWIGIPEDFSPKAPHVRQIREEDTDLLDWTWVPLHPLPKDFIVAGLINPSKKELALDFDAMASPLMHALLSWENLRKNILNFSYKEYKSRQAKIAAREASDNPAGSSASSPVRRFMFSEGGSNKFWEANVAGRQFIVNYGRIGTKGQNSTKTFTDAAAAQKEMEKLVREKLKKGYRELSSSESYPGGHPPAKKSKFAEFVLMDNAISRKRNVTDDESDAFDELYSEVDDDTIAVDHSDWEMDVVDYINDHIKPKIKATMDDANLKLTYKGKTVETKLPESSEGRWITVYLCSELIKETHRCLVMKSSFQSDTLVYVVKEPAWWDRLKEEIGEKEFNQAFCDPIEAVSNPKKLPKIS